MAIRLGLKISGASLPQIRSASPAVQFRNNIPIKCVRNVSGVTSGNVRYTNRREKKSKDFSSYDRSEKDRHDFTKEYDAVEQYELEAAKPRDKSYKTNEIYDFMTKLQRNQSIRVLPHLQPNNLKPYGSTDNMIFPEILKPRDWIKYPSDDQKDEHSIAGSHDKHEDMTNKRDMSSFEKSHSIKSADIRDHYNKDYNQDYDTESQESKLCEKCSSVPWPSYSDSIKPRENVLESNVDSMNFNQTRKLSTNIVSNTNLNSPVQSPINLTVNEPKIKVNIIKDPILSEEIREPILNNKTIEAKKKGRTRKPPQVWDEYCPEEEIIEERCVVPQKEKKLPKLIPKDCPCIEPPEPCDVPPLPRLNLEVCEPRPECPQPCDDAIRADEDCWEYLEPATVDCRTIPHKHTKTCKKTCKRKKGAFDGHCKHYSTSATNLNIIKRHFSLFSTKTKELHPLLTITNSNKLISNNSLFNPDRWINSSNTAFKEGARFYSKRKGVKRDNKSCCEEIDVDCDSKCRLPKFELPPNPDKNIGCKRYCEKFCNPGCAIPECCGCVNVHQPVCCEKSPTPYPSYSECVVTYITPFTNETNYTCETCGRTPRTEDMCCRKFSTFTQNNLFNPVPFQSGKRYLSSSSLASKPFAKCLVIPSRFYSCENEKPCKMTSLSLEKRAHPRICHYCRLKYPHCHSDPCRSKKVGQHCYQRPPIPCFKNPTPYPSFSECMMEDLEDFLTECPASIESTRSLQPDYVFVTEIPVLEASYHVKMDPTKEDKCVKEKLCIKNSGVSQSCHCFGKPHVTLKSKDFMARNDFYTECEKLHRVRGRGFHTLTRRTIIEEDLNQNAISLYIVTRNTSTSQYQLKCSRKQENRKFQLDKNQIDQCSKDAVEHICILEKDYSAYICNIDNLKCRNAFYNLLPNLDHTNLILYKPLPHMDTQIIPRLYSSKSKSDRTQCKCETEYEDESCINVKKYYYQDRRPFYKRIFDKIICYFKARPDCPPPEEFRRRRLIEIAEKAAKKAGLAVCDPKELKCHDNVEYPKIITPEKCVNQEKAPKCCHHNGHKNDKKNC